MPWKESEIATLRNLWGKRSARLIGLKIRKTKNAVIGKANRIGLKKLPSPIKYRKIKPLKKVQVYVEAKRGNCQWIEGNPVARRTTDEGKCLKPTVYRNDGKRSSYCLEHTKKSWRTVKIKT